MTIYVVKEGDTLESIASVYNISTESIIYNNQIPYPYNLANGQSLLLSVSSAEKADRRSIYTGGYAYPFISRWVLKETLPYLTYLYIFSYGFTAEGDLIPPALDDTFMLELAHEYGVSPILTLTPFGNDGRFNNNLISSVVNNADAREKLLNSIIMQIETRGFEGVDIDFEYILASDRDAFVDFVAYFRAGINELGYPVSVALAPKTSDDQPGLLYEGKDYKRLGEAADYVLLMTYEWGYKYGPPMAVAPINKVREVIDYALTVIAPEKIHIGIPNYGYDWPLPYVRSETVARTLGNIEAVRIAIANNAAISYNDIAQSPYYNYMGNDSVEHEVWFEDPRSIDEKLKLITQYGLRGLSCWQIMQLFRADWLLTAYNYNIKKTGEEHV